MASIGFVLSSEQFPAPKLVEFGAAAEKAGFDMVWNSDHFHPWMDNQGHSGHAWITLAALGQQMHEIPMGTGVTCPTYRYHPSIVAQAFASLAVMYPGRVFLGVGSGEALNEKAATGQWGDYDERAERMEEAIKIIRMLWSGDWVVHQGKYYQVHDARLYDLPQQPIPIYVAAGGEESTRLAGRLGDGWITDAETALTPKMRDAFMDGAQSAGKNPDAMPISAELFVFMGTKEEAKPYAELWRFSPKAFTDFIDDPDPRSIQRRAQQTVPIEDVLESWVVSSDPEKHIQKLQELIDGGVTNIFVHSANPDQEHFIDFYAQNVLPNVQHERMRAQPLDTYLAELRH